MKIKITLRNFAGELDSQIIEIESEDEAAEISDLIWQALRAWELAPGDSVQIIRY